MSRPQFTIRAFLRTLLAAILVVAAFLAGMALQQWMDEPNWIYRAPPIGERPHLYSDTHYVERIRLRDGLEWQRMLPADEPKGDEASQRRSNHGLGLPR